MSCSFRGQYDFVQVGLLAELNFKGSHKSENGFFVAVLITEKQRDRGVTPE
jgi:hypothetical protein